jgi:redox-sensitive bicupin YhaK (pirin superfamily)
MIKVRPSNDRGHFKNGWLDSRHTFSFGEYYDPQHLGFSVLRVINDDLIAPGAGFPTHGHRDMEIITYVLDGAIEHKDSLGNGGVIRPGEIQRMSAGTGVSHSEFNPASDAACRLLQIWLLPSARGLAPGYEQATVPAGALVKIAGQGGTVAINQDAGVYALRLKAGEGAHLDLAADRTAWVQAARGSLSVNGTALAEGDGAAVTREAKLDFGASVPAEAMVFDLPRLNN